VKKEHKSFQSVVYLFSLNPNPSTLFFYALVSYIATKMNRQKRFDLLKTKIMARTTSNQLQTQLAQVMIPCRLRQERVPGGLHPGRKGSGAA
jgi:hypothetical protein